MTEVNREFGRRMDSSSNKQFITDFAKDAHYVLDLGAGTGKISREIAAKTGANVDSVDMMFKEENLKNTDKVTYYSMTIEDFLVKKAERKKYDCIVLSAILHELSDKDLSVILKYFPVIMADNCRVIIREPFYDDYFGPVKEDKAKAFVELVKDKIPAGKAIEYANTPKCHSKEILNLQKFSLIDWVNLSFTCAYGIENWDREKHEERYARSLSWCKTFFDFKKRGYTSFFVRPILDETYKEHFANAGLPAEAFDLITFTTMFVVIDYTAN